MPKLIPKHITSLPPVQALRCVCGVMAHPKNLGRQHEFISWGHALAALESTNQESEITLPRQIVRSLTTAAERGVGNDFDAAIVAGSMAGGVLLYVLQAKATGLQDFGIDKATFMVSEALTRERRTGSGRETVRANWTRFREVAHLWAAFLRVQEVANDQQEYRFSLAHAYEFFQAAQSLLLAASTCPLSGGSSLLERGDCWEFEGIVAAEAEPPKFTESDLRTLALFKPRNR